MMKHVERTLAGGHHDLELASRLRVVHGHHDAIRRRVPEHPHVDPVIATVREFAGVGSGGHGGILTVGGCDAHSPRGGFLSPSGSPVSCSGFSGPVRGSQPHPQAAATLRAVSNSSSGIGAGRRHVKATGCSPRWSTYVAGPRNVNGNVPSSNVLRSRTKSSTRVPRATWLI